MKMRISKLKLLLLMAMSIFGLWASTEVIIVFDLLKGQLPWCPQGGAPFFGLQVNCDAVLGSRFNQILGIPLDLFAVIYFVINLALVYTIAFGGDSIFRRALTVLFAWRFIGLIIVPYLVSIEVFILGAICVYCTIMHVAIVIDFIIISYFLFYKRDSLYASTTPAAGAAAP
ncbi:MAG TPA: vitamin K epoxide reductase family protein [Nitrososphaerales archaeon]|nr:vitamin K epoxide reductase family protein [Nitrososphaerales archaeon]